MKNFIIFAMLALPTAEEAKKESEKVAETRQVKELEEAWLYTENQIEKTIRDGGKTLIIDLDCFSDKTRMATETKLMKMGYKVQSIIKLGYRGSWRRGLQVSW